MDNPETGSNQAQESSKDRLAGLLKAQYGNEFTYEAPEPAEPESQPQEPVAEQVEPAETPPETEEAAETQPEPESQPEAETVDFEAEGKQYKVPKELEAYLLRDKDYRHKTMELADEKKSVAAMKQATEAAFQASTQFADLVAGIKNADAQLERFKTVDWATLRSTDPLEFSNLQHEMRAWMDVRQQSVAQFQASVQKLNEARVAEHAQEIAKNEPIVRKAIPDWGPEKQRELAEVAKKYYGYTDDDLRGLTDARSIIALRDLAEYQKLKAKRPETAKVVTAAPPVNKATAPRVSDKEIQLKKAEARLAKTGDPEDALAVLRLRRKA